MLPGLVFISQTIDPMALPIPDERLVQVAAGVITNTKTGQTVTVDGVAAAADGKRWVFIGESHDNAEAHLWQARIIQALVERGRKVIVGMEMYQRQKQDVLTEWSAGLISEEQFIEKSEWKTQWGFDFALYKPIFDVVKKHRLPLVALNVPREWVRIASRQGYEALPAEAKAQLPEMYLGNKDHRRVFDALMQGHAGPSMDGMYRGQVLWDEAMADSALKFLEKTGTDERTAFVVVAGNGHLMYGQGINYRIKRRTGQDGITIITADVPEGKDSVAVSAGLADFVVGVRPPQKPPARPK